MNNEDKIVEGLQRLVDIQLQSGNYDYDPYMYGMTIGMQVMLHTAKDIINPSIGDIGYCKKPVKWLSPDEQKTNESLKICQQLLELKESNDVIAAYTHTWDYWKNRVEEIETLPSKEEIAEIVESVTEASKTQLRAESNIFEWFVIVTLNELYKRKKF